MAKKAKKVRVVLIDPEKKEITELHIEPDLSRYYFWLGCDCLEVVLRQVNEDEVNTLKQKSSKYVRLYVDETGGYTRKAKFILRTKYGNEELIGKAMIVGELVEDGDETDCLWSLDDVRKFIFFDITSLRRFIHDNRE